MSTTTEPLFIAREFLDITVSHTDEISDLLISNRIGCKNSYLTSQAFAAEENSSMIHRVGIVVVQQRIGFDELINVLRTQKLAYGCIRTLLAYLQTKPALDTVQELFAPGQTFTVAGYVGVPFFKKETGGDPMIDLDFPTVRTKRIWLPHTAILAVGALSS